MIEGAARERAARLAMLRAAARNSSGVMMGRRSARVALSLASVLQETCTDASGGRVELRGTSWVAA
jgi:hypothetical protein